MWNVKRCNFRVGAGINNFLKLSNSSTLFCLHPSPVLCGLCHTHQSWKTCFFSYSPELEDRPARSPSSCKARFRSLSRSRCRSQRGRGRTGGRCSLQGSGCGPLTSGSSRGAEPFLGKIEDCVVNICWITSVAWRRTSSVSIGLGVFALTRWAPQDTKIFSGFDSLWNAELIKFHSQMY